jgi:4-hydroxy 2-oxovalerate aldolase
MSNAGLHNILDVTLRDGGYLNNWSFSVEEINATLSFLDSLGLRWAEVGFLRSPEKTTSLVNGCPLSFLKSLHNRYRNIQLVGMLNPADGDWNSAIIGKLPYISLIRIPCTSELVESALEIAHNIKAQACDVKISLNLICISSYSYDEIQNLLIQITKSPDIDIVYFADSRGALRPNDVEKIVTLGKKTCSSSLGFHAHDTLGNALENSNRAIACGCEWIDATFNGFGLAGGNLSLENYLIQNALLSNNNKVTKIQITEFINQSLPLKHPSIAKRNILKLLANKNIDPIWDEQLQERYQQKFNAYIEMLPWNYYKSIDDVFCPEKSTKNA